MSMVQKWVQAYLPDLFLIHEKLFISTIKKNSQLRVFLGCIYFVYSKDFNSSSASFSAFSTSSFSSSLIFFVFFNVISIS